MYPFDVNSENIELAVAEEQYPRDYKVKFYTDKYGEICGYLTGDMVEGKEAIKQWAFIALLVARYKYQQYSWYYGNEIEDLIGGQFSLDVTESEAHRMIYECLTVSPFIVDIEDFTCNFNGSNLTCSFTIKTNEYGDIDMVTEV